MYREDYRRAGFHMLSLNDENGAKTCLQMLFNGVFLLIASVSFYFMDQGGVFFLGIALVSGFGFLAAILSFINKRTVEKARSVFLVSIVYLPVLCSVMVVDRLFS